MYSTHHFLIPIRLSFITFKPHGHSIDQKKKIKNWYNLWWIEKKEVCLIVIMKCEFIYMYGYPQQCSGFQIKYYREGSYC